MKTLGNRVLLQTALIKRKELQPDGTTRDVDDIAREGVVFASVKDLTSGNGQTFSLNKGDKVYYNPNGCVEVESKRTKKALILCIDAEDVYVLL